MNFFATQSLGEAFLGAYSISIAASGGVGSYTYSIISGSLPTGLNLYNSASVALISGSVTSSAIGVYYFTLVATDANNCMGSQDYSLIVTCPAITLSPPTISNSNVYSSYNTLISSSGGVSPYTYSDLSGSLPAGLSLSSSGLIHGTSSVTGSYSFIALSTDSELCSGQQLYNIVINCPTITLTPSSLPSTSLNMAYTQSLTASGLSGSFVYSIISSSLPTGFSLNPSGIISGSSSVFQNSLFTIQATNSSTGCTVDHNYSLLASCPSISFNGDMETGSTCGNYSSSVTATGGSGVYTYSVIAGSQPNCWGGTLNTSSGLFTANSSSILAGTWPFTYQAEDSNGCIANVALTLYICSCNTSTIPCSNCSPTPTNIALNIAGDFQGCADSGDQYIIVTFSPFTVFLGQQPNPDSCSWTGSIGTISETPKSSHPTNCSPCDPEEQDCSTVTTTLIGKVSRNAGNYLLAVYAEGDPFDPLLSETSFPDGGCFDGQSLSGVFNTSLGDGYPPSTFTANISFNCIIPETPPCSGSAPFTDFIATPLSGSVPLVVSFTDTSLGVPTNWYWAFGDGGSSTLQNPTYTYTVSGVYTITLISSNLAGSSTNTKTNLIYVSESLAPLANFIASPLSGSEDLSVSFTDTSTNSPISWSWSFGDGGSSTSQNPTYIYTSASIYTVSLTASNSYGSNTDTKINLITVIPVQPPTASFVGYPTFGVVPLAVSFTDTSLNSPTNWHWKFGDSFSSSLQNPIHIYSSASIYSVSLTASNAGGSSIYTRSNYITTSVSNVPSANFNAHPTSGVAPLAVTFTDTSLGPPISWSWSFGDGTSSISQNPVHTYLNPGNYTVILTASNASGYSVDKDVNLISVNTVPYPEEFYGPFASWWNLKTDFGAVGNGSADDTIPLSASFAALASNSSKSVLYIPPGTYRITSFIHLYNTSYVQIVGDSKSTVTILYDGPSDGIAFWFDIINYSKFSRMTFDGQNKALVLIDQSMATNEFDTGNGYEDIVFKNSAMGVRGGEYGYGFAETTFRRCFFNNISQLGINLRNYNALDCWVWNCVFTNCYVGIGNYNEVADETGAGNFHIFYNIFLNSSRADVEIGNPGQFNAKGNYSSGSNYFWYDQFSDQNPCPIRFQDNTVVDPLSGVAFSIPKSGPMLFLDNIFATAAPPLQVGNGGDADVIMIGNEYITSTLLTILGGGSGRVLDLENSLVSRGSMALSMPSYPTELPKSTRTIIDVPVSSSVSVISSSLSVGGITHLPAGIYTILSELIMNPGTILVGDGGRTKLNWSGSFSGGSIIQLSGSILYDIFLEGGSGLLSNRNLDNNTGIRILDNLYGDQLYSNGCSINNILVDGMAQFENLGQGGTLLGTSSYINGTMIVHAGASSDCTNMYYISNTGILALDTVFYQADSTVTNFINVTGNANVSFIGCDISEKMTGSIGANLSDINGNILIGVGNLDRSVTATSGGTGNIWIMDNVTYLQTASYWTNSGTATMIGTQNRVSPVTVGNPPVAVSNTGPSPTTTFVNSVLSLLRNPPVVNYTTRMRRVIVQNTGIGYHI